MIELSARLGTPPRTWLCSPNLEDLRTLRAKSRDVRLVHSDESTAAPRLDGAPRRRPRRGRRRRLNLHTANGPRAWSGCSTASTCAPSPGTSKRSAISTRCWGTGSTPCTAITSSGWSRRSRNGLSRSDPRRGGPRARPELHEAEVLRANLDEHPAHDGRLRDRAEEPSVFRISAVVAEYEEPARRDHAARRARAAARSPAGRSSSWSRCPRQVGLLESATVDVHVVDAAVGAGRHRLTGGGR